jgi:putative endonuclease
MDKHYYIYLLTNTHNTVIYTGITNDLVRRVYEHKNKLCEGFSKKINFQSLFIMKFSPIQNQQFFVRNK